MAVLPGPPPVGRRSGGDDGLGSRLVVTRKRKPQFSIVVSRGAWRGRDTNGIFAHYSLIFYFLDFKFSNFVLLNFILCSGSFLKKFFRKRKNIRNTTQNALAPSIFIVLSIRLKLGTPLLHTQAQNTVLQNF